MTQVQIPLSIAKDLTAFHLHEMPQVSAMQMEWMEQGRDGMIFTWCHPEIAPQQLVTLGLDISGVPRWQQMLAREPGIAKRAFTEGERRWAGTQPERLAMLWSIKEAFVKALGCGFSTLAYREVAIEFGTHALLIVLPAVFPTDIPGIREFSDAHWQLILFTQKTLTGALIFAWKQALREEQRVFCEQTVPEASHTSLLLECKSISIAQHYTRRERQVAERQAARDAAISAASRLLHLNPLQPVSLGNAPGGRPLLYSGQCDRERVCLSLSHCSGWGAAAVGISLRDEDVFSTHMGQKG